MGVLLWNSKLWRRLMILTDSRFLKYEVWQGKIIRFLIHHLFHWCIMINEKELCIRRKMTIVSLLSRLKSIKLLFRMNVEQEKFVITAGCTVGEHCKSHNYKTLNNLHDKNYIYGQIWIRRRSIHCRFPENAQP